MSPEEQRAAWQAALRGPGRVVADVGRLRGTTYAVAAVLLGAIGAGLLVVEGTAGRAVGALLVLLAVPMLAWGVRIALRLGSWRSPHVVVDADGITVRHGRVRVPWAELRAATATVTRHNRWVTLSVTPDCYARWVAGRPRALRWMAWRHPRNPALVLPPDLRVDPWAFAGWLSAEVHERQLGEVARLRAELEQAAERPEPQKEA